MVSNSQSGIRDNYRRGNVGDFLKSRIQQASNLSIVSAYFTIYTYDALKNELDRINRLRFLFGEPSFIKSVDPDRSTAIHEVLAMITKTARNRKQIEAFSNAQPAGKDRK